MFCMEMEGFMQQKNILKEFKVIKFIQLVVLIIIEVVFFLVLILNNQLSKSIFTNRHLFVLAAMMWGLMIFSLLELLYDFYKLKSFATETHALNQAAYLDNLTGIPNRYSCDLMFSMYTTSESIEQMGCCLLTISNLSDINDRLTHEDGDHLIQDFCELLETSGDRFGFVGRNSGNEFLAIIEDCHEETMESFLTVLNSNIDEYNENHTKAAIEIRYAYILNKDEKASRFTDLITLAYKKLNLR